MHPILEKLMSEFGSEEKIVQFKQDIRLVILESSVSIGYLRWVSLTANLNLTFEGIKFNRFVNEKNLKIDEVQLICQVKNKSQSVSLEDNDILRRLTTQKNESHDPWQVCCGHDMVEILSLGLRKTLGSNKRAEVESSRLERSLRLAYEEIYFHETQLYLQICRWENDNQPFKVLRNSL
ncbi:hypothetical protein CKA32_001960 [Geitlerinema sp. FC II]|nr:hypothetical protein CKA32_001960 [Geitlerinema sp. FC II]